jgi:hypothetical protein
MQIVTHQCSIPSSYMLGPFRLGDIITLALMLLCAGLVCLVCTYIAGNNRASKNQRRNYRDNHIGRG